MESNYRLVGRDRCLVNNWLVTTIKPTSIFPWFLAFFLLATLADLEEMAATPSHGRHCFRPIVFAFCALFVEFFSFTSDRLARPSLIWRPFLRYFNSKGKRFERVSLEFPLGTALYQLFAIWPSHCASRVSLVTKWIQLLFLSFAGRLWQVDMGYPLHCLMVRSRLVMNEMQIHQYKNKEEMS